MGYYDPLCSVHLHGFRDNKIPRDITRILSRRGPLRAIFNWLSPQGKAHAFAVFETHAVADEARGTYEAGFQADPVYRREVQESFERLMRARHLYRYDEFHPEEPRPLYRAQRSYSSTAEKSPSKYQKEKSGPGHGGWASFNEKRDDISRRTQSFDLPRPRSPLANPSDAPASPLPALSVAAATSSRDSLRARILQDRAYSVPTKPAVDTSSPTSRRERHDRERAIPMRRTSEDASKYRHSPLAFTLKTFASWDARRSFDNSSNRIPVGPSRWKGAGFKWTVSGKRSSYDDRRRQSGSSAQSSRPARKYAQANEGGDLRPVGSDADRVRGDEDSIGVRDKEQRDILSILFTLGAAQKDSAPTLKDSDATMGYPSPSPSPVVSRMPLPFQNHSQTGSDVDIDNSTLPPDAGEIIKMLEESNCTSANWATVVAEYYAKGWLGTAEIVCQAGLEFVKQDENVKLLTVLFEKIKASQAEKGTGTQATQPTEINCLTEAVDLAAEGQIGNNSLEELQRKFPVDEGDANSSGDTLSDIRPLETLLSVTTQEAASPVQLEDGEVVDPELAKLRLLYQVAKSMVAAERAAKRKVEDEISAQRATIRKIEDVLFETEKEKVRREASMKQDRLAREKAERELDEMRRERDVLKRKNRDVEDELRATIKSKSKKSRFQTRHEHPASTT